MLHLVINLNLKNDKMKIIQISSASSSYSVDNYKEDIYRAWSAQIGFQIKKFYPKLDVECWTIEKEYKNWWRKEFNKIKFRIFPTNLSIRHGMEISFSLVKALKEEIKKSEEKNERLIVHIHEYHSWLTYQILNSMKNNDNVRVIAQHHGGRSPFENLMKYKMLFLFFPLIATMQFFESLLLKKINVFYALSDNEILYLKKIAPKSIIKFQTMGIENDFFKKKKEKNKLRIKLGLEKNIKYLLYVGRIKTTKGIKELLNAYKKIRNDNVKLLLLGGSSEIKIFEEYSKINNIKNVEFLGSVYGKKRLDYFDACDFLILPSYTEGAPVVIMEAIAKNLPVIATNVGGINKMIENGREGIIIKPKSSEEIVKAINEIITWKRKNIRRYAEKYKWKIISKNTIKNYEKDIKILKNIK